MAPEQTINEMIVARLDRFESKLDALPELLAQYATKDSLEAFEHLTDMRILTIDRDTQLAKDSMEHRLVDSNKKLDDLWDFKTAMSAVATQRGVNIATALSMLGLLIGVSALILTLILRAV